jgi:hypothetical protein
VRRVTGTITGRLRAIVLALLAVLSALVISYKVFLWMFIKYWEWQHEGRRMKFTFWADERALPLALIVCVVVFFLTTRYLRSRNGS